MISRRDQRGNVAIIFAFAAIPLISAIGCAVDYSIGDQDEGKAAIRGRRREHCRAFAEIAGLPRGLVMTGNGSVTAGVTDATNVFNANMSGITGYTNLSATAPLRRPGSS